MKSVNDNTLEGAVSDAKCSLNHAVKALSPAIEHLAPFCSEYDFEDLRATLYSAREAAEDGIAWLE